MNISIARGSTAALMLTLLATGGAVAQPAGPTGRPTPRADAAALRVERVATLAREAGLEVVDARSCTARTARCTRLVARQPNGEILAFEVAGQRCGPSATDCLGGYVVSEMWGGRRGDRGAPGSAAKISAKPGEDGAPPDPQDEAQAAATNEIIEALADGKYENNIEGFWRDLESIQTWQNPSWEEPDPAPPVEDRILVSGGGRGRDPAALVSGRYRDEDGEKNCAAWVGYTSSTTTVEAGRNWIGNAVFDGCDSEVAVFSENSGAVLEKPEKRWSTGTDTLSYTLPPPITVPATTWIVYADTDFADEAGEVEAEYANANAILEGSRCGIVLAPSEPKDRTGIVADPEAEIGCASIETVLKTQVGYHPHRMNVYIVNRLIADDRAGVACTAESDNVIILDQGRGSTALVHEFGHWFDLWHTADMPQVNPRNIMAPSGGVTRDLITAGQCYRANFSRDSYINVQKLRSGKTKKCEHLANADGQCPGVKNEF